MAQPSLLDYARFHGLAADHKAQDILLELLSLRLAPVKQTDARELHDFQPPVLGDVLTEAKFQLTRHERDLLAYGVKAPALPDRKALLGDHHKIRNFKLEIPILTASKGRNRDMLESGFGDEIDLQALLEEAKEDLGEAKEITAQSKKWFEETAAMAEVWDQEIQSAKMTTTREAIWAMQRMCRDDWTQEMQCEGLKECLKFEKKHCLEPISLILTPWEPEPEPYLPSSPALQLMLRSDPADLHSPSRRQVLDELQKKDKIGLDDIPKDSKEAVKEMLRVAEEGIKLDIGEEIDRFSDQNALMTYRMRGLEDMKLGVPLSPPNTDEKMPWGKKVMFKDELEELISDLPSQELGTQDVGDRELDEALLKLASDATREIDSQLHSEKIQSPDLRAKLDMPTLQFPSIHAPWEISSQSATNNFLGQSIEMEAQIRPVHFSSEDEMKLRWVPFSVRLAIPNLEETFEDEAGYLENAITRPTGVIRSVQLLWRPQKLRLLDKGDESDEENWEEDISLGQRDKPEDTTEPTQSWEQTSLPLKRPLLPAPDQEKTAYSMPSPSRIPISRPPLKLTGLASSSSGAFSTAFSATTSLESFIGTRGKTFKRPKLMSDHFTAAKVVDEIEYTQEPVFLPGPVRSPTKDQILVPVTPTLTSTAPVNTALPPQLLEQESVPLPGSQPLITPRTIMLNNTLLRTHRSLVSHLESHAPDPDLDSHAVQNLPLNEGREKCLTIIYRDFGVISQGSSLRGTSASAAVAPDLILNPTTCLILTTLQAFTQRSLPGHEGGASSKSSGSMVHNQILNLIKEYDEVFVLVSQAMIPGSGLIRSEMSANASSTWMGLVAFCSSLVDVASVNPILVPISGKKEESNYDVLPLRPGLEKPRTWRPPTELDPTETWVWALITQHAFRPAQSLPPLGEAETIVILLQDETLWSLFLQRCGLNPFAAQVVLGTLQRAGVGGDWGLRRFVQMSWEERIDLFGGDMMCGRKAVERVCEVLDRVWE